MPDFNLNIPSANENAQAADQAVADDFQGVGAKIDALAARITSLEAKVGQGVVVSADADLIAQKVAALIPAMSIDAVALAAQIGPLMQTYVTQVLAGQRQLNIDTAKANAAAKAVWVAEVKAADTALTEAATAAREAYEAATDAAQATYEAATAAALAKYDAAILVAAGVTTEG